MVAFLKGPSFCMSERRDAESPRSWLGIRSSRRLKGQQAARQITQLWERRLQDAGSVEGLVEIWGPTCRYSSDRN